MATNTAASFTNLTGNGTAGPFSISFNYIDKTDVEVFVDGVLKTETTHYTFTSQSGITFTTGNEPANGAVILFKRNTGVNATKVSFNDASVLKAFDLNLNNKQFLHAVQELIEDNLKRDGTKTLKGNLIFEGATEDNHQTSLTVTDPTQDNTITLPDRTGTVITSGDTGTVSSTMITDGTIVNADINASAAIAQSKLNIANATTSAAGYQSATDKTKLDGIESNATADQTAAEIRTLVESATDSNVFTDADHTKLNGIEANADVTDATNVDAAGAVMNSDLNVKGKLLVGDGTGDPTALSVGQNNYVLIADSTETTGVKWGPAPSSGGLNNIVEDTSPQLGGALDVQAQEINTSTTNGNIKLNPNGTGVVEIKGDGSSEDGTLQLNCSQNSHGVKIKSPAHSAGASYTLTLPINIVNGQFLKTDANGNLSWAAVDLTSLSATNLTSGTIPDARFPATLPAISGANLTNLPAADLSSLNASNLSSGTIPDARFPATLPAISGANLTNLPAANLSNLNASNLTSGTIPDARFPATLPAISGANLTNLPSGAGSLVGGSGEEIFVEVDNEMNNSFTTTSGRNYIALSNLTIAAGVVFTITTGTIVNFT